MGKIPIKFDFKEIIRFVIVGVIATALHYGIYYMLILKFNVNLAFSVGYIVGFITNFYLSSYFTFKVQPTIKRGVGFMLSNAINYSLSIALLNLYLYFGVTKQFAPIFVFVICIPLNFILVRYFLRK